MRTSVLPALLAAVCSVWVAGCRDSGPAPPPPPPPQSPPPSPVAVAVAVVERQPLEAPTAPSDEPTLVVSCSGADPLTLETTANASVAPARADGTVVVVVRNATELDLELWSSDEPLRPVAHLGPGSRTTLVIGGSPESVGLRCYSPVAVGAGDDFAIAAFQPGERLPVVPGRTAAPPVGAMWRACTGYERTPPCGAGMVEGVFYPYRLGVHCGVRFVHLDGRIWLPTAGHPFQRQLGTRSHALGYVVRRAPEWIEFGGIEGERVRFGPAGDAWTPSQPCA